MPTLTKRIAAKRNGEIGIETTFDDEDRAWLHINLKDLRCPYCNEKAESLEVSEYEDDGDYAIADVTYRCNACNSHFKLKIDF